MNDLKRRLINVWADMQQRVIDDAIDHGGSVCTPVFEPEEDILSMPCVLRTILINAANYCYHLIVKIDRLTRYCFRLMLIFDINVSHGSVATRLRCDGIFHNDFIANLPLSLSVEEF